VRARLLLSDADDAADAADASTLLGAAARLDALFPELQYVVFEFRGTRQTGTGRPSVHFWFAPADAPWWYEWQPTHTHGVRAWQVTTYAWSLIYHPQRVAIGGREHSRPVRRVALFAADSVEAWRAALTGQGHLDTGN
jgi:hypothetical protein